VKTFCHSFGGQKIEQMDNGMWKVVVCSSNFEKGRRMKLVMENEFRLIKKAPVLQLMLLNMSEKYYFSFLAGAPLLLLLLLVRFHSCTRNFTATTVLSW
jgi:hypothetical protein